jgi:hypothetical protein
MRLPLGMTEDGNAPPDDIKGFEKGRDISRPYVSIISVVCQKFVSSRVSENPKSEIQNGKWSGQKFLIPNS